jgi:hypothetical protein
MRTIAATFLFVSALPAFATEAKVVGDQLILSGRASGNELVLIRDAIAEHGDRIGTVILRDHSGRTENTTLMRAAELIGERGWRTAISGFCGTACTYLFLGGTQRHFTDDKSPTRTTLQFGSTNLVDDSKVGRYNSYRADSSPQGNYKYRAWIKGRTGDRMSETMLDRLFIKENEVRYLHFFDSNRLKRADGVSILLCDGKEPPGKRWEQCEKLTGTDVYKEGLVTSNALIRSNDRPADSGATPKSQEK